MKFSFFTTEKNLCIIAWASFRNVIQGKKLLRILRMPLEPPHSAPGPKFGLSVLPAKVQSNHNHMNPSVSMSQRLI